MITIYSSNWCSYCKAAKNLLDELNLKYEEINIEEKNISRQELEKMSGGYTVPQISINGTFIGGFQELQILNRDNKLLNLVQNG